MATFSRLLPAAVQGRHCGPRAWQDMVLVRGLQCVLGQVVGFLRAWVSPLTKRGGRPDGLGLGKL